MEAHVDLGHVFLANSEARERLHSKAHVRPNHMLVRPKSASIRKNRTQGASMVFAVGTGCLCLWGHGGLKEAAAISSSVT